MIPLIVNINGVDMMRLRDRVLTVPVFGGVAGDYPWDRFDAAAKEAGLPPQLASLGRSVFREAFQHDWHDELKVECGWLDGGQAMIYQALAFPDDCESRWGSLLEHDGDEYVVEPVTTDIDVLAEALEAKGYRLNYLR